MHNISISTNNTIYFDNLNNDGKGSLREALKKGLKNTIVKPDKNLKGIIILNEKLNVNNISNVIMDFEGKIEVRGWGVDFRDCKNLHLINIIHRTTDIQIRKHYKNKRPSSSVGLDCYNFSKCNNVLVSKCSLWSSCDEIVSVVGCEDIHFEQCFFGFPLSDPDTHPYGKEHAECSNNSGSNIICYYQCVFAYYRMRGPMFETNDITKKKQQIKVQAVNCVMYGFTQAGSKYHSWVDSDIVKLDPNYKFQLMNNLYVNPKSGKKKGYPIVCDNKGKTSDKVHLGLKDNKSWNLDGDMKDVKVTRSNGDGLDSDEKKQIKHKKITEFNCLGDILKVNKDMFFCVLDNAGVNDELDRRAKDKMKEGKKWELFKKFSDVESFLDYKC